MHSAKLSELRSRTQRRSLSTKADEEDEFHEVPLSSLSRPSTQDSKRSSYSRLSTDSGAGSLEDFNNRRYSSPDFWRDSYGRRHTAPTRKLVPPEDDGDDVVRPNTVHVWEGCSPRCSLSRYAPLPAIGAQQQKIYEFERPVPVRRQCFMGPLDIDNVETVSLSDVNDNDNISQQESEINIRRPLFSLTLDSETDSDFDEESERTCPENSDNEDADNRPRRSLIRSATFTIEKERPEVRGPFLNVAVRLPDGSRVAGRFDCKDTLESLCEFALQKIEQQRPQRCALVTTDVPKRIFKDLSMSLKEAGIDDKTLLYLQLLDDCDSE